MRTAEELADLSYELLAAIKRGEPSETYLSRIAGLAESTLAMLREDESAATAFWVNLYNAAVQHTLERDPSVYENRRKFFGDERISVAGTRLSLDEIEHGILRSSKWKYGLGYVPRPFPNDFERAHRLSEVDPRIHFALNCGAESCPPIVAYTARDLDRELDLSTRSFLEQSIRYDRDAGEVTVTRLFLYYRGDFGGRRGIYSFLETYDVIDEEDRPRVRYDQYDWTRHEKMFREARS